MTKNNLRFSCGIHRQVQIRVLLNSSCFVRGGPTVPEERTVGVTQDVDIKPAVLLLRPANLRLLQTMSMLMHDWDL
jgi:hypothetical protein